MYGIAKGGGGIPVNGAVSGTFAFDAVNATWMQKVDLGTVNANINNKSYTSNGFTFSAGSSIDDQIKISGSRTGSYGWFMRLSEKTNASLKAGYYCFDANPSGTFTNARISVNFSSSSYSGDIYDDGTKLNFLLDSKRSTFFKITVAATANITVDISLPTGSSASSGSYVRPRLYFIGDDPFSKLTNNRGMFWKSNVSTSESDRIIELVSNVIPNRKYPLYLNTCEGISCIYIIDGLQISNKARTTVLDSKPLAFVVGKNMAISPFDSEIPTIRPVNTIIE